VRKVEVAPGLAETVLKQAPQAYLMRRSSGTETVDTSLAARSCFNSQDIQSCPSRLDDRPTCRGDSNDSVRGLGAVGGSKEHGFDE